MSPHLQNHTPHRVRVGRSSQLEVGIATTERIRGYLSTVDEILHERLDDAIASAVGRSAREHEALAHDIAQFTEASVRDHLGHVTRFLDRAYGVLESVDRHLSPAERISLVAYHRAVVQPFFLRCPLVRRANDRPLGYPGDFGMVEMIFQNQPHSPSALGQILSRYVLECGPARAHRDRRPWLLGQLRRHSRELAGRTMRVLSLACGPEHTLRAFAASCAANSAASGVKCELTLSDMEPRALEHCRKELRKVASDVPVRLVPLSVLQLIKGTPARRALLEASGGRGYDAIIIAGLLDYLDDRVVCRLIGTVASLLADGGLCLLTNVAAGNPWRVFMEYVGDWHLIHRSEAELLGLITGADSALATVEVVTDPSATNLYYAGRKALSQREDGPPGSCTTD